jgi:hypothetical protein
VTPASRRADYDPSRGRVKGPRSLLDVYAELVLRGKVELNGRPVPVVMTVTVTFRLQ